MLRELHGKILKKNPGREGVGRERRRKGREREREEFFPFFFPSQANYTCVWRNSFLGQQAGRVTTGGAVLWLCGTAALSN